MLCPRGLVGSPQEPFEVGCCEGCCFIDGKTGELQVLAHTTTRLLNPGLGWLSAPPLGSITWALTTEQHDPLAS